jgi:hypothetical protein
MNDLNQSLMVLGVILIAFILIVFGVINSSFIQDYKETKRIFEDFCKSHYRYKGHIGDQIWFSRIDEDGEPYQYNEIVFFGDGSIKLRENYYIHKGFLIFTLVHRYYYKKFNRVKEQYIHQHRFAEQFRRVGGVYVRDRSIKSKEISSFKFFRG